LTNRSIADYILGQEINQKTGHKSKGPKFPFEKVKAYISYVKKNFTPRLTIDANRILQKYYQLQRGRDHSNTARTTVDFTYLD
jgi:DNA helicase MCM9